jgi:histidine ammonia-lyase
MHPLLDFSRNITVEEIFEIAQSTEQIKVDDATKARIEKSRKFLDQKSLKSESPIYGVNTGFGSLCNTVIDNDQLSILQENLLRSHACGMGEEVPSELVRFMLLLKVRGLCMGYSGVSLDTLQGLIDLINHNIMPVIYQQGSLGASGDLAPLAHLSLPLIGEGDVLFKGKKTKASDALKQVGLSPIKLRSKEGLALINGTQFMSAYAVWCIGNALRMVEKSCAIAAMSLDAFDGRIEPFDASIHRIRPHHGQQFISERMRELLAGSEIASSQKTQVQDPYSFRCIPQVAGASYDAIQFAKQVIEIEINSVTDNPLVIAEEDKIISGGNFHGQPLALQLDYLAIALAELGSISERRTYKLISGQRNLPAYLAPNPGLNSGFMIAQYTAASIVSQNKQLCTPSSIDSIDSSNGQEDHVSMGANAATKCFRALENVQSIFAIELFTAAQALDFRRPARSSDAIEKLHQQVRSIVPFIQEDIYMSLPMNELKKLI